MYFRLSHKIFQHQFECTRKKAEKSIWKHHAKGAVNINLVSVWMESLLFHHCKMISTCDRLSSPNRCKETQYYNCVSWWHCHLIVQTLRAIRHCHGKISLVFGSKKKTLCDHSRTNNAVIVQFITPYIHTHTCVNYNSCVYLLAVIKFFDFFRALIWWQQKAIVIQ